MFRARRPIERSAPVDVAITRIRGLAAILAGTVAILGPDAFAGPYPLAPRVVGLLFVAVLLGINALATMRRRRHWSHVPALILIEVALDLTLAIGLVLLNGSTEAPSLILALPLIEAGLRFGTLGVLVSWSVMVGAVGGRLVLTVPVDHLGEATRNGVSGLGALVLVALPMAYLAEHLIAAVHHAEEINARSDDRAWTLEVLATASLRLTTLDRDQILERTAEFAVTVGCVHAAVWHLGRGRARLLAGDGDRRRDRPDAEPDDGDPVHRRRFLVGEHDRYLLTWSDPPDDPPAFRDEAVEVLTLQARAALNIAAGYEQVAALERENERAARTDELTGLPNRRALATMDADARLRGRADWAVVYVDLNSFKAVNDTAGHDEGDALLRRVARHLAMVSSPNPVFRVGGDEFLVVLAGVEEAARVDDLAATIERTSRFECVTDGGGIVVGASAGIAFPEAGEGLAEVAARADKAMYGSKRRRAADRPVAIARPDGGDPTVRTRP
jgi:diguanylate cyclase (GGDEF)-like protein